jgi:biopolymer transport protein ExbD
MSRKHEASKNEDLGFQIAPMIDIIFLLILYFMVKVGENRVEMEIRSKLPASAESATNVQEQEQMEETVGVDVEGTISHNDDEIPQDTSGTKDPSKRSDLQELKRRMKALADQGAATKTEVLVTVTTAADAKYGRVIDVLNSLQYAGIKNMTFTTEEE